MKANRFCFICMILFFLYISLLLHEVVVDSHRNGIFEAGKSNQLLNRSIAVKMKVNNNTKEFCRAPRIAILLSAQKQRRIQLYWDVDYVQVGDWIALFKDNPQAGDAFPIFTASVYRSTGIIRTNFSLDASPLPNDLKYKARCLGYWAAYFLKNGSEAEVVSCLKTNPTWMYDIRHHIENVPIKRLFIPGTHDAGAYSSHSDNVLAESYVVTQDENTLSQLIMGIRYLDMRISYQSHTLEKWWINHGVVTVRPLAHVLEHLKTFLNNTKEIVILDFHRFHAGFENEASHQEVIHYLKSELSEWIAPPNWNSTCGELWKLKKTLIVAYNNAKMVANHSTFLWPPVHHHWANTRNIDALKQYLQEVIESRPSYSWAAMAELTPRAWDILTLQAEPLRNMADMVNPQVTSWFRTPWGRTASIVAVDFFRGTDIVYTAIEWNIRKHLKPICDIY